MTDVLDLTASIVSAHVSRNEVEPDQLPELIRSVYDALTATIEAAPASAREPAVPIRKSVFSDHIVCLQCGKSFRTLKRHLEREHGISTAEYRQRFALSDEYPLAAPEFREVRAQIAKRIGLGRQAKVKRRPRQPGR